MNLCKGQKITLALSKIQFARIFCFFPHSSIGVSPPSVSRAVPYACDGFITLKLRLNGCFPLRRYRLRLSLTFRVLARLRLCRRIRGCGLIYFFREAFVKVPLPYRRFKGAFYNPSRVCLQFVQFFLHFCFILPLIRQLVQRF